MHLAWKHFIHESLLASDSQSHFLFLSNIGKCNSLNCCKFIKQYFFLKSSLFAYIERSKTSFRLHMVSAMGAGLAVALVSSPVDVVKTRIMNQKVVGKNGTLYRGAVECLVKTVKTEGIFGLYKGFLPNWLRAGPQTLITFCIFEQLRKIFDISPV